MKLPRLGPTSLLKILPLLMLAFVVVGALAPEPAPATMQSVEMEVIPVQGQVYMLQTPSAGGNVGVLPGPEGVLLVDDQVPGLVESVIQGVRAITDEEIRFVLNTHVHIDHQGGNAALYDMGATLVAHDNTRLRMLERLRIPRAGGRFMPAPPERARPLLTFDNTMTFHMNGEEVRAFLVPPSHTDGDVFVYFVDSDVLHTGDVFRTNMYPIIDVYNGGTVAGLIEATRIAIGMSGPNTKIIPGHGFGFTDRDGLVEVLDMMVDIRETIIDLIGEGMHLEEVLAANPTAVYDAQWGQEPGWNQNDLVPIIYHEVGGGRTVSAGRN
ncbi:MAG TPA: MBL fold metallo-hydrolase [Gemmatimonadetes bacterium]|nr:MBL fold metallo-hydrolase [Gemmatimonadota bacterium]